MTFVSNLRLSRQLGLLVILFVTVLVGAVAFGLWTLKAAMIAERKAALERLIDTAVGVADAWRAEAAAGRLERAAAEKAALAQLRPLRFGPERDYFFVQRFDGMAVLNPASPQLEGRMRIDAVDADGIPNVRLQIEAAQVPGGGFVYYRFPRSQGTPPIQKLAHCRGIAAWQWAVCAGVYLDDVEAAWRREALVIVGASALGIVALVLGAALVGRGMIGPLRRLVATLDRLTSGDRGVEVGDTERRNEIGALARAVAAFKTALGVAERLEQEMRAASTQEAERHRTAAATARSFGDDMDKVAHALRGAADHLRGQAERLAGAAEVTLTRAASVRSASSVAKDTAVTIAGSAEQMTGSIGEIGRAMTEASRVAREAVAETEGARATMADLSAAVEKIGEIVSMVTGIASQTNLLALNATIEAARAGEAGKGFAVVASEVKALSNQTTRATEDISAQIAAIQDRTGRFVDIIQRITRTIGTIGEMTVSVAAQVEQQQAGAAEIARAVSNASASASDIDAGILDVAKEAEAAQRDAGSVLDAAAQVAEHAQMLDRGVSGFLARATAAA